MSTSHVRTPAPVGVVRSPWLVLVLSLLTLGVYYLVWYVRLNKEVAHAAGVDVKVRTTALWVSQCLPLICWVGLARTARRLGAAQERIGLGREVSTGRTLLTSLLPGAQAAYLQRHANALWRALETQMTVPSDPLDLFAAYSRGPLAITAGP